MNPKLLNPITISEAVKNRGDVIFENPAGYDLNIVGIRSNDMTANTFNDFLSIFYKLRDRWIFFAFPATTDPGLFWRKNPMNVRGTAIIVPGQYRSAYSIGTHHDYPALQQTGELTVWRDADRDRVLDTGPDVYKETGHFGCNIHRASFHLLSSRVDKWSAGCQVIQDPTHFMFFMKLCEMAAASFGNSFTYTLLLEDEI
ncbi:hypothetical protein [Desulfoluna spongiiphila]|uniref:Uncharacterized protein n=1 Tax=Desulfoluna spongiiphila TaxID=419481 RepID=A0A1G5G1C5_9BACT|nr:hypothetical protein [Desulfoluna spongiiphila]SCY45169.1 hypothetical protein SAMN05216233_109134 [Desulfoluna spongiiphila]VVS95331.1 hypothetical protein DBB_49080 [Desulfoluna spongiiphila]